MPDNKPTNKHKVKPIRNELGQYVKGTPSPNPAGAPKRGSSWAETVRRITDMTRDELIDHVGKDTTLGRSLKELPAGVPMKDAIILVALVQFGRDPQASLLTALMNREEGMPRQTLQHEGTLDASRAQDTINKIYGDHA